MAVGPLAAKLGAVLEEQPQVPLTGERRCGAEILQAEGICEDIMSPDVLRDVSSRKD